MVVSAVSLRQGHEYGWAVPHVAYTTSLLFKWRKELRLIPSHYCAQMVCCLSGVGLLRNNKKKK